MTHRGQTDRHINIRQQIRPPRVRYKEETLVTLTSYEVNDGTVISLLRGWGGGPADHNLLKSKLLRNRIHAIAGCIAVVKFSPYVFLRSQVQIQGSSDE